MTFTSKDSYVRRSIPIIIILVIIFSMQQLINYFSYDFRGPSGVVVDFLSKLGLEVEFTRMIIWNIMQLVITVILTKLFIKKSFKDIGYNFNNIALSFKYIIIFILSYPVLCFIGLLVLENYGMNIVPAVFNNQSLNYIIKDLLAYGTLPGIGEEPLFRVFIIQFLVLTTFKKSSLDNRKTRLCLIILSSVFFSLGHIFISWSPFYLKFNVVQLILAFILGIFYSAVYLKTKSIFAPIICHNYSDFISRLMILIFR